MSCDTAAVPRHIRANCGPCTGGVFASAFEQTAIRPDNRGFYRVRKWYTSMTGVCMFRYCIGTCTGVGKIDWNVVNAKTTKTRGKYARTRHILTSKRKKPTAVSVVKVE